MKNELHACVGIDLSRRAAHKAVIITSGGIMRRTRYRSFSFAHTCEGLRALEVHILKATGETSLEHVGVNMEATTGVWQTVAQYFYQRGAQVFCTRTDVVSAARKTHSKFAKSDRIDARTLAGVPWNFPERLNPYVPREERINRLRALSNQQHRLAGEITRWKNRILAQLEPIWQPLLARLAEAQRFSPLARRFFGRFARPSDLMTHGRVRFSRWFERHAHGNTDEGLEEIFWNGAEEAAALEQEVGDVYLDRNTYGVIYEMDEHVLVEFEKESEALKKRIAEVKKDVPECAVVQELPGVGAVISATLVSHLMPVCRFSSTKKCGAYTGYTSRKQQSGTRDIQGLKITKTGNRFLKRDLALAADTAMHRDPIMATFAIRLLEGGKHYNKVRVAVGRKLAVRAYSLLKRVENNEADVKYEFRDNDGNCLTKSEAKTQAATLWEDYKIRHPKKKSADPRPHRGSPKAPNPGNQRTSQST